MNQGNPLDEWTLAPIGNLSVKEKSTLPTYNLEVLNLSNTNNLPEGLESIFKFDYVNSK